jgi:hypothetical protein
VSGIANLQHPVSSIQQKKLKNNSQLPNIKTSQGSKITQLQLPPF